MCLTGKLTFRVHYLIAAAISFCAGATLAYILCVLYVFDYRRIENKAVEFISFGVIGVLGLLINLEVLYTLVERFHLHYVLSKGAAAAVTFFMNFSLRRFFLFKPMRP